MTYPLFRESGSPESPIAQPLLLEMAASAWRPWEWLTDPEGHEPVFSSPSHPYLSGLLSPWSIGFLLVPRTHQDLVYSRAFARSVSPPGCTFCQQLGPSLTSVPVSYFHRPSLTTPTVTDPVQHGFLIASCAIVRHVLWKGRDLNVNPCTFRSSRGPHT